MSGALAVPDRRWGWLPRKIEGLARSVRGMVEEVLALADGGEVAEIAEALGVAAPTRDDWHPVDPDEARGLPQGSIAWCFHPYGEGPLDRLVGPCILEGAGEEPGEALVWLAPLRGTAPARIPWEALIWRVPGVRLERPQGLVMPWPVEAEPVEELLEVEAGPVVVPLATVGPVEAGPVVVPPTSGVPLEVPPSGPMFWRARMDGIRPEPVEYGEIPWERVAKRLTTCAKYRSDLEKKRGPGWMPVRFKPGQVTRKKEHIDSLSALVLDFDELTAGGLDALRVAAESLEVEAIVHTSWSHEGDEKPKARLIIPLDTPCPAGTQWARTWGAAARWAASHGLKVDDKCKDEGRFYLLPGLPEGVDRWGAFRSFRLNRPKWLSWVWLASRWREPTPAQAPAPPPPPRAPMGETREEMVRYKREIAYMSKLVAGVASAPQGGRTPQVFGAAMRLGGLHAGGSVADLERWRGELVAAAMSAGLPEKEARRHTDRGVELGAAKPEKLPDR